MSIGMVIVTWQGAESVYRHYGWFWGLTVLVAGTSIPGLVSFLTLAALYGVIRSRLKSSGR